jgi:putative tricarboxylic transport membrane protein
LKADRIAAIVFILGALVFWSDTGQMQYNGYIFPWLIIIMLIVFSAIMFIQTFSKKEEKKEETASGDNFKYMSVAVILVLVWIALLDVLGFIVSSVLSLTILTTILEHQATTLRRVAFTTSVYTALLIVFWYIFHKLLLVPLPTGYFI